MENDFVFVQGQYVSTNPKEVIMTGSREDFGFIHDLETGSLENIFTEPQRRSNDVEDCAVSENKIVLGTDGETAYVYSKSDYSLQYQLPNGTFNKVLGTDITENFVAYAGEPNKATVADVSDGSDIYTFTTSTGFDTVLCVALSDTYVAFGGEDDIAFVHNLSDGSLEYTLTESGSDVLGVGINDIYVAYGGKDNNTYIHSLSDGSLTYTLSGATDEVESVALSSSYACFGDDEGFVRVHNLSDGSQKHKFRVSRENDAIMGVGLYER